MAQAASNVAINFSKWHQRKSTKSHVWVELQQQGLSEADITAAWNDYTQYRMGKRISLGWVLMFGGGAAGLMSCILTMIDPLPELRWLFMYAFTTAAVSVSLYGCYLVMEKPDEEMD